jgi:hypothetical protein
MGADDVIIAQAPEKPGSMMVLLDATSVTLRVRGHFDVASAKQQPAEEPQRTR